MIILLVTFVSFLISCSISGYWFGIDSPKTKYKIYIDEWAFRQGREAYFYKRKNKLGIWRTHTTFTCLPGGGTEITQYFATLNSVETAIQYDIELRKARNNRKKFVKNYP